MAVYTCSIDVVALCKEGQCFFINRLSIERLRNCLVSIIIIIMLLRLRHAISIYNVYTVCSSQLLYSPYNVPCDSARAVRNTSYVLAVYNM